MLRCAAYIVLLLLAGLGFVVVVAAASFGACMALGC